LALAKHSFTPDASAPIGVEHSIPYPAWSWCALLEVFGFLLVFVVEMLAFDSCLIGYSSHNITCHIPAKQFVGGKYAASLERDLNYFSRLLFDSGPSRELHHCMACWPRSISGRRSAVVRWPMHSGNVYGFEVEPCNLTHDQKG